MVFSTSAHDDNSMQSVLKVMILGLSLGLILIISSVVMLKVSFLPFSCEFVVGFWNSVRCFLSSPLYICIIINSMVLLIAALSHFQPPPPPPLPPPCSNGAKSEPPRTEKSSIPYLYQCIDHHDHDHDHDDYSSEVKQLDEEENKNKEEEEDEEEGDTMEATWKAISGVKLKHLTKSETFTHAEESSPAAGACTWKDLKKSETFNEAVSIRRRGGMRRDPSVGIDEFNQQVEAFIKKFNDDMRLQRQQSDQRFIDMINRGI